jgi:carboxyl-terminal processing protease
MNADADKKLTVFSFRVRLRFLVALGLVLALSAGAALERWVLRTGIPADASGEFRLMAQAWKIIDRFYVDRAAVRRTAMTQAAINGMIDSLGDTGHSVFLGPNQARKAGLVVQGKLTGVGMEIQTRDHQAVVVAPMEGSPAELAGVRPGDVILQVNGRPVTNLPLHQVSARISGEAGQAVELTVVNPHDGLRREVKIMRASLKVNNVAWQRLPGTQLAHLRIAMFSEGESADLRKALLEIKQQGLQGVILDLRNNPGGALDEAVATTSQFLKSGNVLWEKDSSGVIKPVAVQPGGVATDLPLALLINRDSASDSEIVAGALHDYHRATLVGETSFGTGTVLSQFQLADGSELLLAVQEWLTPDKRSFWHRGIEPDVKVALAYEAMPLRPAAERELTPEQLQSSGDAQLLKAMEVLSNSVAKTGAVAAGP